MRGAKNRGFVLTPKRRCGPRGGGFTLIETVIYIALTGFMMSMLVAATYQMIDSSGDINVRILVEDEAGFIIRKLSWAMSGADQILEPASGATGSTLRVNKSGSLVVFNANGGDIEIRKGGGSATVLNSTRASIENLEFTHIPPSGGSPAGVEASFTLLSNDYTVRYFLR